MKWLICGLLAFAFLTAGPTSQNWTEVGVIVSDVSRDESLLWVKITGDVVEGRAILLEDRDSKAGELYEVRHVYGDHIWLKSLLRRDYLAGSKLYQ